MGFFRQEYWSGLPFPSSGDLPDPGIEPTFPSLADGFFTTEPPGKPRDRLIWFYSIPSSNRQREILICMKSGWLVGLLET